MSGHSKWSTIKHKKAATDAKRGKAFSRAAKEIIMAAKQGGGDQEQNIRLRSAVQSAKAVNMPNDTIDRAIKRGTGELEGVTYEELTYEIYAPGGVAILLDILTDNKNRTASEIRALLSRKGGSIAGSGSVAWLFEKKGLIRIAKDKTDEDTLYGLVIDAGADDIKSEEDAFEVLCEPDSFEAVKSAVTESGIELELAEVSFIPKNLVAIEGRDAEKVLDLIEDLEDHDDVQNLHSNFDIPDEMLDTIE